MAGGLQVLSPNGNFVNATPIEDTIVVNAADLLTRWSNDIIKSTKHRVVEPPKPAEKDWHPSRYSIAYFCNPNFDRFIDAIPGTYDEAQGKKYAGVNRSVRMLFPFLVKIQEDQFANRSQRGVPCPALDSYILMKGLQG